MYKIHILEQFKISLRWHSGLCYWAYYRQIIGFLNVTFSTPFGDRNGIDVVLLPDKQY